MNLNDVQVRRATSDDFNDVMNVERLAFGEDGEAVLVEDLLADQTAEPYVSFLACYQGEAIVHILLTKASLEGSNPSPSVYILAPLAVKPEYQKQGFGGLLIREGHRILKEMGVEMVFVLGHKEYYPRHGFKGNAEAAGYPPPYPIEDIYADCWMYQSLTSEAGSIPKGKVRCADALDKPEYWRE